MRTADVKIFEVHVNGSGNVKVQVVIKENTFLDYWKMEVSTIGRNIESFRAIKGDWFLIKQAYKNFDLNCAEDFAK